jgi:hypothetical protein
MVAFHADAVRRADSATLAPPPLTPEQLAMLPHEDAGPKLDAVIWVLNGLATTLLILRLWAKWSRGRSYWWDDLFIAAAWVCGTAPPSTAHSRLTSISRL